jgi:hypothetical protein
MAPAKPRRYFAGLSRNTFLLALASLFADISTEMLYPVLPIFLTQTLKASGTVVGLVEGVAQATQNIVQGFSGSLSDRLQRRKPIALVGYLLAAIAKPLMGVATVWQGVLGGRFLDRFGTGTRSAPRDALIASSANAANRGKAFGLEGVGDNAERCREGCPSYASGRMDVLSTRQYRAIMFWFLRKRVDVLAEADEFMESFGQSAYQEARYELAKAFERGDKARIKFLERVSEEIAKRTDFEPEPGEQEPYSLGATKGTRIH